MSFVNPISVRRNTKERGNVIIEFALITPFLMILLAGTFTIGMSLNRSIQASNLCRNANVLIVRGVNLMTPENQNMLIRSASGMGFNLAGTNLPDPNGKGAVYVTKVVRVGSNECYAGISTWNGNASTCANFDEYVIAQRVKIANTSRWSSALGSVSTQTLSDGSLYDSDIAINTGVRASGFSKTTSGSGIIYLNQGEFAYICEVFADVSELNMLPWLAAPSIAVRNVS